MRPDGSIATPKAGNRPNGSPSQIEMQRMQNYSSQGANTAPQVRQGSSLGHADDGRVYNANNKRFSNVNQANGGVGVTYSNVVLGGGLQPDARQQGLAPKTSYHDQSTGGHPYQSALLDHSNRYVSSNSQANVGGNKYAYVKGVDFNSK